MSYTQSVSEPSPKTVLKKCCGSTCRSYVGGDCKGIFTFHKMEAGIYLTAFIMFVICGIIFAKLAYQDCPDRKLLLVFGGLVYCLPATIFTVGTLVLGCMYLNKVWIAAKIESRQSMYHQRLYPESDGVEFGVTRSISSDGYTVRFYPQDEENQDDPHNDL